MNDKRLPYLGQPCLDVLLLQSLGELKILVMDFDGVLTTNSVFVDQKGRELVECSRFDGVGLGRVRKLGIHTMVISAEHNPVVIARCRKLKLECLFGVDDKLKALKEIAKGLSVQLEQIAYMGNDLYDLPCLHKVGFPLIVADAHLCVQGHGFYKTNVAGGRGAVREICDLIFQSRNGQCPQSS